MQHIAAVAQWEHKPDQFNVRVMLWLTLFTHRHFDAHDKSPEGNTDLIGY